MQESTFTIEMKNKFHEVLASENSRYNSVILSKEQYYSLIEDVKRIKASKKKESTRDYRIIDRYDVVTVEGCEKLVEPVLDSTKSVKAFVHTDELFDILYSTHLSIGHAGRDKMAKELNHHYKNITIAQIKMFLNLCDSCQQKSEKKIIKPFISDPLFNSRCRVDVIDYQSQPDGNFKYLLVYQDLSTKFVVLRPLTSKQSDEIASHLLDVFLLLGAPCIMQSSGGSEFCIEILMNLKKMWPELKMVYGKPKNSQSQASVDRANQDIENMLTTWMADNKTNKWSEGIYFVQLKKNQNFHAGIKMSPYEAMFKCPARVGRTINLVSVGNGQTTNEEYIDRLEASQVEIITVDVELPFMSKSDESE